MDNYIKWILGVLQVLLLFNDFSYMLFGLLYLINNQYFLCFCFPFIRIPAIVFFKLLYRGSGLHCRLSRAGKCLIHFNQKHFQRKRKRQTQLANAKSKYLLYTQQYTCHEHHAYNSDGVHHQTQNILFHNHSFFPLDKYHVTVTSSPPTKSSGVMSKEDSRHSAASSAQPRVRACE